MMTMPVSFRDKVRALSLAGIGIGVIAARCDCSVAAVHRMIYKLRLSGELPPHARVAPGSLPGRALAAIEAAGSAGRSAAALQAELVCAPLELKRALRRLCELEAARPDPDGRYRAPRLAPVPVPAVSVTSSSPEHLVGHALLMAEHGQRQRAIGFLHRACDRLPSRGFAPVALNLLAIADLLDAPETVAAGGGLRGYGGFIRESLGKGMA